ncbi:MAG: ATP-binding protein, partial [Thermoanaerobaculia bacterium]
SALDRLTAAFGLSPFERDILVLCAAMELDGTFGSAIAAAGENGNARPTFGVALAALPNAHWSALAPHAPLRQWMLVEVDAGATLTTSPIRIDERVLHYLAGVSHLDRRWSALVTAVEPPVTDLPPSHTEIAQKIDATLGAIEPTGSPLLIELTGNDPSGKKDIAWAVAASAGLRLYRVNAADLQVPAAERELLARLWERESILGAAALFIDADDLQADAKRALASFLERVRTLVFAGTREPLQLPRIRPARFEVTKPTFDEQRELWRAALGPRASQLNGELDRLPSQFDLSARTIASTVSVTPASDTAALWDHCRTNARPRMDDLAKRITPIAQWDDIILPQRQVAILRELAAHVRQRAVVYEQWGFRSRSARGLGISALFSGTSGTGKTMAAEVLANELHLDLYQIDLSSVISKYIGETEENLRRVFDAAEEGGAILLFDEADALFGKRTEVKDSHDRYANIEVSYLLQRMEAYRGVAILTTNMKTALDQAFLRRLRFIIEFPFPDNVQRADIWRRAFPSSTPVDALDPDKLARLNVPGGTIRNIAMNAAFLAADAREPVRMTHVLAAAR